MMDAPQSRFGSKKGAGSCKCGGKCGPCKSKTKTEKDETASDEPDGDRDDNNGMSPSLTVNRPMPSIMTDAMDTSFYREDAPTCKSGNKPCGNRCIPSEYDCSLSQSIRKRHMGYVKNNIGANVAGLGTAGLALGASKATGKKRAALAAASAVSGLGAAAMGGRATYHAMKYGANQLAQAENEKSGFRKGLRKVVGYGNLGNLVEPDGPATDKKKKGRGDSIWASGFEHELSESF